MNLIFGSFGSAKNSGAPVGFVDAALRVFNATPTTFEPFSGCSIGYLSDSDQILGHADSEAAALILLGVIHAPVPAWSEAGSPVDSAIVTARYLLNRYLSDPDTFLDGVFGHYTVIVADKRRGALTAICDPQGMRALYYNYKDGDLLFSSNIFLLERAINSKPKIDRSYENFFLTYSFYPFDNTQYEGIKVLDSGRVLTVSPRGIDWAVIKAPNPWGERFGAVDWASLSLSGAVDVLYDGMMTAHEEILTSNEEVGVLLGGVNSALVASIFHRLGKKVETYSFGYEKSEYNQTHTDTLQTFLGSKHHWIPITTDVIADGIENYARRYSRPTNWLNYPIQSTHLVNVMRQQGIRYCYSGDGCDGVFLGYPRTHVMASLLRDGLVIPPTIMRGLEKLLSLRVWENTGGRAFRVCMHMLRNMARRPPNRGFLTFGVFDEISVRHLRTEPSPANERHIEEILGELTGQLAHLSADRLAYAGKSTIAVNKTKIVGCEDVSGLPVLSPYMHPGMAALAKSIPDNLLRPKNEEKTNTIGKYILLKMIEEKKLLPNNVIYQKKISAVDAPADDWYFGPLSNLIRSNLKHLPFKANEAFTENLMRKKFLEKMYSRYVSTDDITSHEVSLLTTYASFSGAMKLYD